jgi:hypothetical protein
MSLASRLLAWVGGYAVLVGSLAAQDPGSDPCRRMLNERIAQCANEEMTKPGRNPSDFSFWQSCRARFQPEYERCASGGDPKCAASKIDIDWVLDVDAGAQGTYRRNRAAGKSPFESVVAAQAHNRPVQARLRECQLWAENYIAGKLSGPSATNALSRSFEEACRRNWQDTRYQQVLGCTMLREDPGGTRQQIDWIVRGACGRLAHACAAYPGEYRGPYAEATELLACRSRFGTGCGGPGAVVDQTPVRNSGGGRCDAHFDQVLGQLKNNARQCGISSDRLESLTDMVYGQSTRSAQQGMIDATRDADVFKLIGGDNRWRVVGNTAMPVCGAPLLVRNQQDSFMECFRVYLCGAASAACGRDLAGSTPNLPCTESSRQCLATHQVPR